MAARARRVIGMLTIGQSPRTDLAAGFTTVLSPSVDLIEMGALDGISLAERDELRPKRGEHGLVTRLADGSPIFVERNRIVPRLQQKIVLLEEQSVALIVLLCTGSFPELSSSTPLLEPERLLLAVLHRYRGVLGVVAPSTEEVPHIDKRWRDHGFSPKVVALPAYQNSQSSDVDQAAADLRKGGVGIVVLSCIGFQEGLRSRLGQLLGVPVLLPSQLVAQVAAQFGR